MMYSCPHCERGFRMYGLAKAGLRTPRVLRTGQGCYCPHCGAGMKLIKLKSGTVGTATKADLYRARAQREFAPDPQVRACLNFAQLKSETEGDPDGVQCA